MCVCVCVESPLAVCENHGNFVTLWWCSLLMCTGSIGENDIVAVNCGLLCCCMVVLTVCVCVCVCAVFAVPTSSSVEWGFCVVGGWLVCCLMCSWIIGGIVDKTTLLL